jgi:hypothetical protein
MYTGKDKHVFWFGVVEDRMDPLEIGRVRVRILGFHTENKKQLPTEKLPWAIIINPVQSASISGKGTAPVGLVEGSWVVGFFVDGEAAQVPIVIGSITGMNEEVKDGENYGDGFRDAREDLSPFPVDLFTERKYPDGKDAYGDNHGAQLKNEKESLNYPREQYSPESSGRERGTPDVNILAINDKTRLDKTIVKTKRTPVNSGLRDIGVDVASCKTTPFKCGVTGESGANKGTIKALGVPGSNSQPSSSFTSKKEKSKQFVDKPTNNNAIRIDSSKTMDGGNVLQSLNNIVSGS